VDKANTLVTAILSGNSSTDASRVLPLLILNYSASVVPALQLGLSGNNLPSFD
jgi:hypothetical protein